MKHALLCAAGLGAWLLAASGCKPGPASRGAAPGAAGTPAIPVVAVAAVQQPVTETITLIGSVAANEMVDLKSETDGVVQEILFQEGQDVARNALLVRLDDTKLAATVAEAEANFKLSEATYARSRQLLDDRLISQQEFDQAAAMYERNRASLDLMKRQLKDARIHAPFAGIVGARPISPGQVISRNTILTTLVDLDPVKVEFYVPEKFLSQIATGQRLAIAVAAFPGRSFEGTVYFVAPQLDPDTRKALVKAEIPNPKRELKPGMFATLELTLQLRAHALVIPEIALMFDGDQARVFVVDTQAVATLRPVRVGLRLPGLAEIVDGLQAGERVIAEGTQKVFPGMKVAAGPHPGAPGETQPPAAGAPGAPAPR